MTSLERSDHILQKPVLTEKATDDGSRRNAYHFRVPCDANKVEIREAVESLFKVKVLNVNTATIHGKMRRRGYTAGRSPEWKRAMVTLAEGNTIEVI
jgi:large subunit ribosomal protein L23